MTIKARRGTQLSCIDLERNTFNVWQESLSNLFLEHDELNQFKDPPLKFSIFAKKN